MARGGKLGPQRSNILTLQILFQGIAILRHNIANIAKIREARCNYMVKLTKITRGDEGFTFWEVVTE